MFDSREIHSLMDILESGKKGKRDKRDKKDKRDKRDKRDKKEKSKGKKDNKLCVAPFMCVDRERLKDKDYHVKGKYQYTVIKPDKDDPDIINADVYSAFLDSAKPQNKRTRKFHRRFSINMSEESESTKPKSRRKTRRLK